MHHLHAFSTQLNKFSQVENSLQQFLTHTEQRKQQQGEVDFECAICFNVQKASPILYCNGCGQGAHLDCLDLVEPPNTSEYFCVGCSSRGEEHPKVCFVCKRSNYMLLGLKKEMMFCYHLFCVITSKIFDKVVGTLQKMSNYNLKNYQVCELCQPSTPNKGEVLACADCGKKTFHSLCAYLAGQHL